MSTALEDLRILQLAEGCADKIWKRVIRWNEFARDVVGKQVARAADSIGANIAESFGRFNFGEKLQFLYYARGSLFETKYWLNRARARELIASSDVEDTSQLTDIAKRLNSFAGSLKVQRSGGKTVRESAAEYQVNPPDEHFGTLFSHNDLEWLRS